MDKSRRGFLQKTSLLAIAGLGSQFFSAPLLNAMAARGNSFTNNPFTLPPLLYAYDSLEPFVDKMTMEIHHTRHHRSYVDNLNKEIAENNINAPFDDIIKNVSKFSSVMRNNAGGHWNHTFFWKLMKPEGGGEPDGKIALSINKTFGSFEIFKTRLEESGLKRFGSGWAWLIADANKKLSIGSTPNQDNPPMDLSELKGTPILGIDVWEHAYYLKYQNRRGEYLKSWWNVVNWTEVNKNLEMALK